MTDTTAVATREETALAPQSRPSLGILTPSNLGEAMEMAKILADSSIVPKDFQGRPGNVLIACQWGAEIGLQPLQAMQSIAVINGRPAIWGDAMLGLVQGSGLLQDISETISEDGEVATCTVVRRGKSPVVRQFTMDEAKKAGLAGKSGPWQQYPRRMLQLRARGFALRDTFADVLRGVAIAEEARDTPVMRDVTPEADADGDTPQTASGRVRSKIAAKKTPGITLPDVLDRIAKAEDEAQLNKVGADCGKLEGEDKDKAREAYRKRLDVLKKAVADSQKDPAAVSIGELIQSTDKGIKRELTNGAPFSGTMGFYETELARIKAEAPDEYGAMLADYEQIVAERDGTEA